MFDPNKKYRADEVFRYDGKIEEFQSVLLFNDSIEYQSEFVDSEKSYGYRTLWGCLFSWGEYFWVEKSSYDGTWHCNVLLKQDEWHIALPDV